MSLSLARHNPTVVQFSQKLQHFCHRILFFSGNACSFGLFLCGCSSTMCCGNRHLFPAWQIRFCFAAMVSPDMQPAFFQKLALGRMPTFTRRLCVRVPFKKNPHGCRRMVPGLLLPLTLLFRDILLPRVIDGSEGGAAFGVGFCAQSLLSCRKLQRSPFEHCPFSFHW